MPHDPQQEDAVTGQYKELWKSQLEVIVPKLLGSVDTDTQLNIGDSIFTDASVARPDQLGFRLRIDRGEQFEKQSSPLASALGSLLNSEPNLSDFFLHHRVTISLSNRGTMLIRSQSLGNEEILKTRLARLCWNTNGWTKPSGRSRSDLQYPQKHRFGFGCEEWLFDTSKSSDGWMHGYLEPVRRNYEKIWGSTFHFRLYAVDEAKKKKLWIGEVRNVEVLSIKHAKEVLLKYHERGWITEMCSELLALGLDPGPMLQQIPRKTEAVMNVRFRVEELKGIFKKPVPFSENDRRIQVNRYTLTTITEEDKWPP